MHLVDLDISVLNNYESENLAELEWNSKIKVNKISLLTCPPNVETNGIQTCGEDTVPETALV